MELIAAIATPRRPSAIGIVRMSGDGAKDALSALFVPQGKIPVAQFAARHAYYGTMHNAQGRAVDRGLAVWFPAERSYTGEDCVELHCHGSPIVLDEMLRAAFHAGARQANAGEFTKRAFLNGRMDLTEAEAVADLIDAETPEMAYNALGQLNGSLRTATEDIYAKLIDLSAHFYALVDYPDEDIEALETEQIGKTLYDAAQTLDALLHTAARGRILKNGIPTALIGAPNVGKSSLLNALLGYDRAIVTDIPGTTRDTVEEKINVGGVLLRLIDTAGLRQSSDTVEMIGVERSKNAAQQAQLLLALIDGSLPPNEAERETIAFAQSLAKPYLLIITHSDLPSCRTEIDLSPPYPAAIIVLSSRSGEGIPLLEEKIVQLYSEQAPPCATILTNARQEAAIARAHHAVLAAADALQNGLTHDIVLTEVEAASAALGELTGRSASEDLVSHIFERFCVGK